MSADPKQVMRVLDYRGVEVRLDQGRLVARSRYGKVPEDMVSFVRYFKDLIINELHQASDRQRRAA